MIQTHSGKMVYGCYIVNSCVLVDIMRVEPNAGSSEGGTLITIYGKHFYDPLGDVKAYISGKLKQNF